jgi:hypothetical protein
VAIIDDMPARLIRRILQSQGDYTILEMRSRRA